LDLSTARVLVVADLLARTAEMRGLQVLTVVLHAGVPGGLTDGREHDAAALGIHPPARYASSHDDLALLGGPVDVHVMTAGAGAGAGWGGHLVTVGRVHRQPAGTGIAETTEHLAGEHGGDALTVRLALLSVAYHQTAILTADALTAAERNLLKWRHLVAGWAESPSRPMPAHITVAVQEAFDRLDTGSALGLLAGLAGDEDIHGVPAGAKFETFLFVDRILGLDLARDIGRVQS
jgi:hypothetical protein